MAMPNVVTALTLTAEEQQAILEYWPDQEAFLEWQREALAGEIGRRAAAAGQAAARDSVREAIERAQNTFPTVFGRDKQ